MKRSILLFLISITLLNGVVMAQPAFQRIFGGSSYDYGYAVRQTFDKGYIVAGATTSFGNGNTDAYLLKVDSLGSAKWHKTFGGINIDQVYSVCETADSGLVIAGYTNSFGNGGYDMYVIRTDSIGNLLWTKTFGGADWDFALSVQQTSDGGFVIAGGTYSYGYGNEDYYVVKTDMNGDTLWTKTYGGLQDEEAKNIIQTLDGGYILTGFSKSFGDASGDIFTVKTNSLGDTLWTNLYSGYEEDAGTQVVMKPFGGYMVVGKSRLISNTSLCGVRYDISPGGMMGTVDSSFGGAEDDYYAGVHIMPDNRLALLGTTFSYGFGLGTSDYKMDIWNPYDGYHGPTFGQSDMETAYSIDNTVDGGYILCGISNSYSPLEHIYLVKTDSNGVSAGSVGTFVTGIDETYGEKYSFLYPNPAFEKMMIDLSFCDQENDIYIKFHNIIGEEISTIQLPGTSENLEIILDNFKSGIYFCRIQNGTRVITERFIVQH